MVYGSCLTNSILTQTTKHNGQRCPFYIRSQGELNCTPLNCNSKKGLMAVGYLQSHLHSSFALVTTLHRLILFKMRCELTTKVVTMISSCRPFRRHRGMSKFFIKLVVSIVNYTIADC